MADEWGEIVNWAVEKDIEDSFKLIVDCSVIHERIFVLPTIIKRLSSNNCVETLSIWSKSDSSSYHLYSLINSFQSDPPKSLNTNILSENKSAKSQFYSNLTRFYLAKCFINIGSFLN